MIDLRPYRLHLIGALLVLLSALLILVYSVTGEKEPSLARKLSEDFKPIPIPKERLFPPAEPSIVPEAILSREPKKSWTPSDAAPFWTDPRSIEQGPLEAAAEREIIRLLATAP